MWEQKKKFFTFGLGEQRLCAYLPTLPTEDTESQLDLTARRKTASEVERMMHWYPCPEMLTSESQLQLTAFPHEGGLLRGPTNIDITILKWLLKVFLLPSPSSLPYHNGKPLRLTQRNLGCVDLKSATPAN